ncbi:MAG: PD-(D/E)XK nuclease family protein [Pseudomonadota bacterium]
MTTIVRRALESSGPHGAPWDAIAAEVAAWAAAESIDLIDAVLLVPFAQLLPEARAAFARRGGWMPRIETTRTLAQGLGPPVAARAGELSFDPTLDALSATALLRSQAWGAAWARRDQRGFEQAVRIVVSTAQEMARAAAAVPPSARAAHWAAARDVLLPIGGPGASERLLVRVALEWASVAPAPATDRLFEMPAPSAWIAVQAGGPNALVDRLMRESHVPGLLLDTDAPADDPFRAARHGVSSAATVCDGFEHEAQCAAAQVLVHVERGESPVALIAQDRVLVRRIRALLERHHVRLLDETGWTLSTTRAAAQTMSLLQAARPDAGTDALLDWLKAGTTWGRAGADHALGVLESDCRRLQLARTAALDAAALEPPAARLWAAASAVLAEFGATRRQPLPAWLAALAHALNRCGALEALRDDDAGRQVLIALRLTPAAAGAPAWTAGAAQAVMTLGEFRHWVDGVLEQATFRPAAGFDTPPEVIVTPLAQAMLRPFAAVVFPGADDKRLGAVSASAMPLGDPLAAALGLPTPADRRRAELLAFAHLLAVPRVTFMRRRVDGSDPLADSPLIERLGLALAGQGRAFTAWHDPRVAVEQAPTPIHMTAPAAPDLLPARLSASACEGLRACPYRFFALSMLRLREDDELEREVEKRDYGNWLHAVLYDFHRTREAPAAGAVEIARLMALARASQAAQGIADADFLPFAASFETFAPRYITWLHERDADGAHWTAGEQETTLALPGVEGIELRGIIDRIDERPAEGAPIVELIDYKTGSASSLKEKVRDPLEDTQLAFYAALMRERTTLPISASYLALDGTRGIEGVPHPEVEASAAALVEGLSHDLRRLQGGAGLPALGVGATCEHCAARGICRRDHWAEMPADEAAP